MHTSAALWRIMDSTKPYVTVDSLEPCAWRYWLKEVLHIDSRRAPASTLGWSAMLLWQPSTLYFGSRCVQQARQGVQSSSWLRHSSVKYIPITAHSAHAHLKSSRGHPWYNHLLDGWCEQKDAPRDRDNCNGCWFSFSWMLLEAFGKLVISLICLEVHRMKEPSHLCIKMLSV